MGLSPWVIGETQPPWQLPWYDDAAKAIDLTGATLAGRIAPLGGVGRSLANNPAIVDALNGLISYQVSATEVVDPGIYSIQFTATFPNSKFLMSDPIKVNFVAAI